MSGQVKLSVVSEEKAAAILAAVANVRAATEEIEKHTKAILVNDSKESWRELEAEMNRLKSRSAHAYRILFLFINSQNRG